MPVEQLPRHCGKAMSRLYIRKGTDKRKWISVGYYCEVCSKMITNESELEFENQGWIDRVVLRGIPWVGFTEHPDGSYELEPFCSSLRSCLRYLGEDYPYSFLMGTSGAAFRLMWNSQYFDGGNISLNVVAKDQLEPFRRAFKAVGREFTFYGNGAYVPPIPEEEHPWFQQEIKSYGFVRDRIIESLRDKGYPVIAFGVVGPPESCIVAGYDRSGDMLIGWSFFQGGPGADFIQQSGEAVGAPATELGMDRVEFEDSGYFRQSDWAKHTLGILLIGDKARKPRARSLNRSSLKWALQVVRTREINQYYGGLRAFKAWAEALEDDSNFPLDNEAALMSPMMCHSDALTMVGEGRYHAEIFLRQIAKNEPKMKKDLLDAAKCYKEEYGLSWECWKLLGPRPGNSPEHAKRLADPDIRRQTVSIILKAREKDAEAANYIEKALGR